MSDPLLEVTDLVKHFPIKSGIVFDRVIAHVKAVDGVSLTINEGETLGLVGESGCGKSTLSRAILQLTAPTSGSVRFCGEELVGRSRRSLRPVRRQMQMIFQDPYASLNPRKRICQIIGEPMEMHGLASGRDADKRTEELLDRVGLQPEHANRYPHEFSGGQRQRIGIARALALQPKLIIADGPSPHSTCPCRRRSSTCSRIFRTSSACPIFSSHTILGWSGTCRSRRRDVPRQDRRKWPCRRSLPPTDPSLFERAAVGGADPRSEAQLRARAPSPRGRRAKSDRPPIGLSLPHPLPVVDRRVQHRRTRP